MGIFFVLSLATTPRIQRCRLKNILNKNMIVANSYREILKHLTTKLKVNKNNNKILYHAADYNAFLSINLAGYIQIPSYITVAVTLVM